MGKQFVKTTNQIRFCRHWEGESESQQDKVRVCTVDICQEEEVEVATQQITCCFPLVQAETGFGVQETPSKRRRDSVQGPTEILKEFIPATNHSFQPFQQPDQGLYRRQEALRRRGRGEVQKLERRGLRICLLTTGDWYRGKSSLTVTSCWSIVRLGMSGNVWVRSLKLDGYQDLGGGQHGLK